MNRHGHPRGLVRDIHRGSSIAIACLLLSFGANAEQASDFRSTASVTPAAGDPLQRLTLPFEVYRDAKPDLADLRLFNAKGEGLPIAFAGTPEPTRETPRTTALSMFPLYSRPPTTTGDS